MSWSLHNLLEFELLKGPGKLHIFLINITIVNFVTKLSFPQQYGLPYSSVTLGRPARLVGRPRENNLFCDLDSRNNMLDTSNLSSNMLNNDLGEERLRGREERRAAGERVRSRSLKRTESFV